MSALFKIEIELVAPPNVWVRFTVCHPDQWDIPASKNFALLVIVEVYDAMKRGLGFSRQRQPMSSKDAIRMIANHQRTRELEHWLKIYGSFDGPSFASEADEAILDVRLVNEVGNPRESDGDSDPQATMEFNVKDPAILSHVKNGLCFDSAMCDCHYW